MQRLLRILIGPELYWVVLYLGVRWLAARNVPQSGSGNTALEWAVWLTATVGVALSFAFMAVPGINRWAMLARLAFAALIGKYPELGRDSGLLGLWMLAAMLGGVVWCVSAGVSLFVLRARVTA